MEKPKFSIFFIITGSTASELDVENAKSNSLFKILIIFMILIPYIHATSPSIANTKNTIAKTTTNTNFNSGNNADAPNVIIVVQMNANTSKLVLILKFY